MLSRIGNVVYFHHGGRYVRIYILPILIKSLAIARITHGAFVLITFRERFFTAVITSLRPVTFYALVARERESALFIESFRASRCSFYERNNIALLPPTRLSHSSSATTTTMTLVNNSTPLLPRAIGCGNNSLADLL